MDQHGICLISSVPIRSHPDHKSEMVSQLLFGELYMISHINENWIQIICNDDSYYGWIDMAQHTGLSENEYSELRNKERYFTPGPVDGIIHKTNGTIIILSTGSVLYGQNEFTAAGNSFQYNGATVLSDDDHTAANITTVASYLLETPYLWGGKTVMGYDCSGFVQVLFRMHGVILPRNASQQALKGNEITFDNIQKGDLAFFGSQDSVTHVGIISDKNTIIHCSAKVRKDSIDVKGIISSENGEYTHQLVSIRRVL